jgi:ParB/RepB/Spo0J family partition protein
MKTKDATKTKTGFDASKPWAGLVPLAAVVRNPGQPRTHFPKEQLALLSGSLKAHGQTAPCTVISHVDAKKPEVQWMLVDGECRWRAARLAELAELLVCYQPSITQDNLHLASFAANFCRTAHTKEETARAIDKEHAAGRTYEEIGAAVGKSLTWAHQMHNLLKLHPDLLRYMDEPDPVAHRKLGHTVAALLVKLEPERQMKEWERVRGLVKSEQYHQVRQRGAKGVDRRPSDDFAYVNGILTTCHGKLETAGRVGVKMLERFAVEQLDELSKLCTKAIKSAESLQAQLLEVRGRA